MSNIGNNIAFVANIWNMLLATGMFTLPFSLWETGIILGSSILLLIAVLSYYTCCFIIESIAIQNLLDKQKHQLTSDSLDSYSYDRVTDLSSNFKIQNTTSDNVQVNQISNEEEDNFHIHKRYEILPLAYQISPFPIYIMIAFVFVGYMYIAMCSNSVILGNALYGILSRIIYGDEKSLDGRVYYLIVMIYFVIVIFISNNNIEDLKKFTSIILAVRLIVILLFFGSMFYVIIEHGIVDIKTIPLSNFDNVTLMIGNTLLFFMIQHSIPGIVEGFKPQKRLMNLLLFSYLFGFVIFILYGFLAFLAFGKFKHCDVTQFPSAIMNYFNLNFLNFNAIGYVFNLYPLFNIITGSIQLISLRNNFVSTLGLCNKKFELKFEGYRKVKYII